MMEDHRKLLVLYGSQTGTAQAVAERIGREAKRLHFQVNSKSHSMKICNTLLTFFTMFENHRKSLIQHDERSELRLHFEWTKVH